MDLMWEFLVSQSYQGGRWICQRENLPTLVLFVRSTSAKPPITRGLGNPETLSELDEAQTVASSVFVKSGGVFVSHLERIVRDYELKFNFRGDADRLFKK